MMHSVASPKDAAADELPPEASAVGLAQRTKHALVALHLGAEDVAVPIEVVREVVLLRQLTRVPGAPLELRGVIHVHGDIVPVLDVALRLGLGETPLGAGTRVVVVELQGERLGLLAVQVSKVDVGVDAIHDPPPHLAELAMLLRGVALLPERFLLLLDLERLVVEAPAPSFP